MTNDSGHKIVAIPAGGLSSYRDSVTSQASYALSTPRRKQSGYRSSTPISKARVIVKNEGPCGTPLSKSRQSFRNAFTEKQVNPINHDMETEGVVEGRNDQTSGTRQSNLSMEIDRLPEAFIKKGSISKIWPPNQETATKTPVKVKSRFSDKKSPYTRSSGSHISNRYLSVVAPKNIDNNRHPDLSVVEIPTGKDSLGASALSEDEYAFKASLGFGKPSSSFEMKHNNAAEIERLIDERVKAEVAKITENFGSELNRIETRMENDYKSRIEELERKTTRINSILSKLLSNKPLDRLEI